MAWKRSPPLAHVVALAALTLALASCGGGSTAGPIVQTATATTATTAPRTPTSPVPAPVTSATAPRTSAAAPAPRPHRVHAGTAGGAPAPSDPARDGSLADAPADAAGEPPTQTPQPPQRAAIPLDERATLVLTRRASPAHYFQQGTVRGTYDGTMELEARITSRGVLVRFTATLPGGTISGRGVAVAILDSTTWPGLRGTAIVTGGTGRFAGVHGRRLEVTGRAKPDASRAHVRLAGTITLR